MDFGITVEALLKGIARVIDCEAVLSFFLV